MFSPGIFFIMEYDFSPGKYDFSPGKYDFSPCNMAPIHRITQHYLIFSASNYKFCKMHRVRNFQGIFPPCKEFSGDLSTV